MTKSEINGYFSPVDVQPVHFNLDPESAFNNATRICEHMGIPISSIKIAMGLVIPNLEQPEKILYGLRNPDYHTEYPDTWGLPSISMSHDEFLALNKGDEAVHQVMNRLTQAKLAGISINPDRVIGWTGRLRLPYRDPQFEKDYYLIMVDWKTKGINPKSIPTSTPAYLELRWLTPEEHSDIIKTTPTKACGACSQLVCAAVQQNKL